MSSNPAFASISPATISKFAEQAHLHHAKKGDAIYQAGDDWERLGFVIDGTLAMIASEGGDRQLLYEQIGPGGFFGVSAIFDGEPAMARTIVLSPAATYAWISRAAVLELCNVDAALSFALATVIARRLRNVTALLAEQISLSTRERLARFLLNFADGTGMRSALEPLSSMTQTQIAAGAGTVKEVVAKLIGEFEADDALRRERGHVRYLNRQKLIRLAAGSALTPGTPQRRADGRKPPRL